MKTVIQKLDAYYRARGIHPLEFRCAARGSCARGCRNFTEARASLVGHLYGDPIRVTVLSLDPGLGWPRPADRTFEAVARRESPEGVRSLHKGRHWYRTYETVAALLSHLGKSYRPEDSVGRFAHVNAAKCTQNLPKKRQAPAYMFDNCRPHLRGELTILAPHVVITQGDRAAEVLRPWQKASGTGWGEVALDELEFFWLRLVHPTAWGGAYAHERERWKPLFQRARRWISRHA